MQYRNMLARFGRFTSPDPGWDQNPEDPQSWNLYSYVRNNPVMSFDPDGRQEVRAFMQAETALVNSARGQGREPFNSAAQTYRNQVLGADSPGLQRGALAIGGAGAIASGASLAGPLASAGQSMLGWLSTTGTALWQGAKDLLNRGSQAAPAVQQEAQSAANGLRLSAQLTLQQGGLMDSAGKLTNSALSNSRLIIDGAKLGDKNVIQALTANGSNIADWGKYTTQSVATSGGQNLQIHYYMNKITHEVAYGVGYKVAETVK